MSIKGLQIIYRLENTIRLFIDFRENIDAFKLYYSNSELGDYEELATINNVPSVSPSSRGKIVFEFNPTTLLNWDNTSRNYIKMTEVIDNVEGILEGPTIVFPKLEEKIPKEFSVMYGFNQELQKFIPIKVDEEGKIKIS